MPATPSPATADPRQPTREELFTWHKPAAKPAPTTEAVAMPDRQPPESEPTPTASGPVADPPQEDGPPTPAHQEPLRGWSTPAIVAVVALAAACGVLLLMLAVSFTKAGRQSAETGGGDGANQSLSELVHQLEAETTEQAAVLAKLIAERRIIDLAYERIEGRKTSDPYESPFAAGETPPADPEAYRRSLVAKKAKLQSEIVKLQTDIEVRQGRLDRIAGFDRADLVLTEKDQGAVAIRIDGDEYTLAATAARGDMPLVQSMLRRSGRARLSENGVVVRRLKRLKPGETIRSEEAIAAVDSLFAPREYVAAGATPDAMIAYQVGRRRDDGVEVGFLLDQTDSRLRIATLTGEKTFAIDELLEPPFIGTGDDLLLEEPRVSFFDYAMLQVARELNSKEKAVYQRVAIKTDINLNEGNSRELSDLSANKNLSWLTVSRTNEARSKRALADDVVGQQLLRHRQAEALDAQLQATASELGLPVVTRDRRAMIDLLQEQAINGDAAPVESLEKELRVMAAAAERGNLPYAEIEHDGRVRQVFYKRDDEQRFREFEESIGNSGWDAASASAAAAVSADAYGYGYGYGGGYGEGGAGRFRRGPRGGAYEYGRGGGFGGGGGGGGARVGQGASAEASVAAERYFYRDGRLYQSLGQQSTRENERETDDHDRYKAVKYAEQVAKRDAAISIEDYGRLAAASHVVDVRVQDGDSPDSLTYKVSLIRTDTGAVEWSDEATLPLAPRPPAKTTYLASGLLLCINPGEPDPRKPAGLLDKPKVSRRSGLYTPTVIERSPAKIDGRYAIRSLFSQEPLSIEADLLIREGRSGEICCPLRLDDKDDLEAVPMSQRLRCVVLKLLEGVAPQAGEVLTVEADGRTAQVQMNNADRVWERGQRLRVLRAPEGEYTLARGGACDSVPVDVTVLKVGASIAEVRVDTSRDAKLRAGDRLVARDAREPLVAVRKSQFFYPEAKTWGDYRLLHPGEETPEDPSFDKNAMPDRDTISKLYLQLGWREMRSRLDTASTSVAKTLRDSLSSLRIPAAYTEAGTDDLPTGTTHLVHLYLKPTSSAIVELGVRVYHAEGAALRTDNAVERMHLRPTARLSDLEAWRP